MNDKKQIVPKLRFPNFTDKLRYAYLEKEATFLKGKGISKNDIVEDGETECIRYGQLYTDYGEIINTVVSKTNTPKEQLVLSKANDVIIPSSGETVLDIATASCVMNDKIALGGDLNIIRTKNNGIFLSYYLNSKKKKDIAAMAQGNSVVHLYNHQLKTLTLNLPSLPEQQKIANFLSAVDKKLTQLQEKQTLLKDYKKGVMQQLFNQALRFKHEDGSDYPDWEEKRLGEIGNFQTSSVDKLINPNEKEVFLVNYMNVYRHENINNNTIENLNVVTAKDSQIASNNLKKGDILFTPSSETPTDIGHSVVIFENLKNTVYSYHLLRFRPRVKIDILFSHYFCNTENVLKQLSRFSTGSTRFTISTGNFSKVEIKLPCVEEQAKIANFLSELDKKIELVTTQIENTQQFKKGLLQQMFV
tara:strand:+ start:720 stop:1970 length:1251 start_codon:yes stop_codon:yes gene_type:complete